MGTDGRRTCYKEAALLLRLRHPAIMPIEAVFCDTAEEHPAVYLQMPFYSKGTLRKWWREYVLLTAQPRSQPLCRSPRLASGRRSWSRRGSRCRQAVVGGLATRWSCCRRRGQAGRLVLVGGGLAGAHG